MVTQYQNYESKLNVAESVYLFQMVTTKVAQILDFHTAS